MKARNCSYIKLNSLRTEYPWIAFGSFLRFYQQLSVSEEIVVEPSVAAGYLEAALLLLILGVLFASAQAITEMLIFQIFLDWMLSDISGLGSVLVVGQGLEIT